MGMKAVIKFNRNKPIEPEKKLRKTKKTEVFYGQDNKQVLNRKARFKKSRYTSPVGLDGLSDRQRNFVREYVKDYCGLQAAIRAGYSKKSAHVSAYSLLKNNSILAAIDGHEKNLDTRFENTQQKVLKEMSIIAHSDIADYLTPEGEIRVTNLKNLPPQVSRAIKKVRIHTKTRRLAQDGQDGKAGEEIIDQHIDFELYDKTAALEKMGKQIGLFIERRELTGKDGKDLIPPASTNIIYDFGVNDHATS
jgi:phage terminase small subunit